MANVISASGYEALRSTNLGKGVIYAGTIKARNWEDDFMPFITNTRVLDDLTKCGQVITFDKPPYSGPWRPYEKNQNMVTDQVTADSFCLSICNAAYKSLKFDKLDIRQACEDWASFETAFLTDAWNQLSYMWKTNLLTGMMLQVPKENSGATAGRYKNINLGTVGNPVELNPKSIIEYLSKLRELLTDTGRWNTGDMFLLVPPQFGTLILQTMYDKSYCCDPTDSVLFKGLTASNLLGFKVIETELMRPTVDPNTRRLVYPILAGWNESYAFTGEIIEAEVKDAPGNSFGAVYNMLSIFGGGVIYPEGLAKGYVTLSTDGLA